MFWWFSHGFWNWILKIYYSSYKFMKISAAVHLMVQYRSKISRRSYFSFWIRSRFHYNISLLDLMAQYTFLNPILRPIILHFYILFFFTSYLRSSRLLSTNLEILDSFLIGDLCISIDYKSRFIITLRSMVYTHHR